MISRSCSTLLTIHIKNERKGICYAYIDWRNKMGFRFINVLNISTYINHWLIKLTTFINYREIYFDLLAFIVCSALSDWMNSIKFNKSFILMTIILFKMQKCVIIFWFKWKLITWFENRAISHYHEWVIKFIISCSIDALSVVRELRHSFAFFSLFRMRWKNLFIFLEKWYVNLCQSKIH